MKKFIYITLFAIVSAASLSACSDEEIKPQTELGSNAGSASNDKGW